MVVLLQWSIDSDVCDVCNVCDICDRTTVLQSMKLGIDVNRHKEIIVKAITAMLLLMLKHFKLNHIYQVCVSLTPF